MDFTQQMAFQCRYANLNVRTLALYSRYATYGYCASKAETYYGFKGNLSINSAGVITGITAAPAHFDERESLWDVIGPLMVCCWQIKD